MLSIGNRRRIHQEVNIGRPAIALLIKRIMIVSVIILNIDNKNHPWKRMLGWKNWKSLKPRKIILESFRKIKMQKPNKRKKSLIKTKTKTLK